MVSAFEDCRLANVTADGVPLLVVERSGRLYDLSAAFARVGALIVCTDDLLAGKATAEQIKIVRASLDGLKQLTCPYKFLPCVVNPQKIVMIGLNYRRHAEEVRIPIPNDPIIFNKFNNALAAHQEKIRLPLKHAKAFDYEAELVIVMGKRAADVSEADALDFVFGYCVGNDLSARDLQTRTTQMLLGKSLDGFAPIGPFLSGKQLVPDPDALDIACSVNGMVRQSSSTSDMIFNCRQLVAYVSRYMTLLPGDLIFTGTPEGVAAGKPAGQQPWLVPGDIVVTSVERLGSLSNEMIAG